jgi:hypothetical protein
MPDWAGYAARRRKVQIQAPKVPTGLDVVPAKERVKISASPHLSWPGALTMQGLPGSPMKPRIYQTGRFTVL